MDNLYKTQVEASIDYLSVKPTEFEWESRYYKNVSIKYEIDIEYKNWGINGIRCSMPDQEISFEAEVIFNDKEDPEYVTLLVKLENSEVEHQSKFSNGVIAPSELEIKIQSINKVSDGKYLAVAKGNLIFKGSSED